MHSEGKFVSALIYALMYVGYLTTGFFYLLCGIFFFFSSQYTAFVQSSLQCVQAGLKVRTTSHSCPSLAAGLDIVNCTLFVGK